MTKKFDFAFRYKNSNIFDSKLNVAHFVRKVMLKNVTFCRNFNHYVIRKS